MNPISLKRLWAIIVKEFIQMRRDRTTLAMMIVFPMIQLVLFGFAINGDPKQLPIAVLSAENSSFTRSLIVAMKNTDYFKIVKQSKNKAEANKWLAKGDVQFILSIPPNFSQNLVRSKKPALLIEVDATDPSASSFALSSLSVVIKIAMNDLFKGSLQFLKITEPAFSFNIHAKYNPLRITQFNIVPGLLGVVLTMTLIMITALSMTREFERGTMENLLAMPTRPLEVMLGKVMPYILVGFIQVSIILIASKIIFALPIAGNLFLLLLLCIPFIAANLMVGLTFSTIAKNQLQAMQLTMFFFLPSILLSGFMFPFKGMPVWAQTIGNILPLTHFTNIIRGIMIKGNSFDLLWPELWPILLFGVGVLIIGLIRYRQTLD